MSRIVNFIISLRVWHLWLVLATMAVVGPVTYAATWWFMSRPPVLTTSMYEEDAKAVSGGDLELVVSRVDNAPCFTQVARWLWRFDPTDPLPKTDPDKRREWREITSTPHSPPSVAERSSYKLIVPLPSGLATGEWHYLGSAVDVCRTFLGSGPRNSRDFIVNIVEPGQ